MTKAAAALLFSVCAILMGENARCQTFEVASIKPADPNARGSSMNFPNGTFTAINSPVRNLITLAYDVQPFQIEGGPNWVVDQRFDIVAKMPAGAVKGPHDPDRLPLMRAALQALLADRFRLAIHRETKLVPGYVLVVAKNGFRLKETTDDGRGLNINSDRGKLIAERISLGTLARSLSGNLSSPVVDMTGSKGVFDVTLEWAPASSETAEASAGPSIFTAVQDQLGLKLETHKEPVEIVIIDRIEKPSEN
jgi:uncharacterized protein (TIGR03435 family)